MRLFEITLLEYDRDITITKFGKRIFQAAKFNEQYLNDNWFYGDGDPVDTEESMIREVLKELEFMDPTDNKQYVMTLVRWYIGNIKKDKQNQAEFREMQKREPEKFAKYKDYKDVPGNVAGGELNDEYPELWIQPQSMNTFKLEDAVQVRQALVAFHRMKPQLPQNERDIGRFKDFYRFEDFVDSRQGLDANFEIDNDTLKRNDVVVLHNGVEGTVAVPKTHQASCELGSGTRWCTASSGNDEFYNSYSKNADLIIYNEKPGNAKYQFQYYYDEGFGIMRFETADARDRPLNQEKQDYFLNQHPILSKILQKVGQKSFLNAMNKPYSSDTRTDIGSLLKLNDKLGGGTAKPYIDDYFITRMEQKSQVDQEVGLGLGRGINDAVTYAQIRGKPWPKFEELAMQHLELLYSKMIEHWQKQAVRGIGPSKIVAFLKIYLNALQIYRDKVNPSWKAFQLFVDKYKKSVTQSLQKSVNDKQKTPGILPLESVDEMRLLMTLSEALYNK